TGLPNRHAFYDRLAMAIADNAGRQGMIGVGLFNVNGTKFINESFGTKVGDEVLRTVATRFRERTRPRDFIARIGGDEFALLMVDLVIPGQAVTFARALSDSLGWAVNATDGDHTITVAGGVATT